MKKDKQITNEQRIIFKPHKVTRKSNGENLGLWGATDPGQAVRLCATYYHASEDDFVAVEEL